MPLRSSPNLFFPSACSRAVVSNFLQPLLLHLGSSYSNDGTLTSEGAGNVRRLVTAAIDNGFCCDFIITLEGPNCKQTAGILLAALKASGMHAEVQSAISVATAADPAYVRSDSTANATLSAIINQPQFNRRKVRLLAAFC